MTIDEYLSQFKEEISLDEYFTLEEIRFKKKKNFGSSDWVELIKSQELKCYYCNTDLRLIQQLIMAKVIMPRKRGNYGYSGLHFELDHKNFNVNDNSPSNLVASCYFCNNDRSNLISDVIYKNYLGKARRSAFQELFDSLNFEQRDSIRHHLKGQN
ncbi:HNH endonuclease [Leadbetterella byssophila DSM 17132]|uniref:HNH endonuclease n=1 Tax=Leadbetterella byssophila (strain DSM 17132 / JCM 16389 / KACC 11308 / NBRC 106382 / 4M15) TaxID=649349 RepID=E4RRZ3_LEAB4|nr:hypothetical protein [Leadbetterella byssophila]ADQ18525.1 HNH endonuclease [Leadbetterella byssophila DSM 17132]